ncbi:uncharacterized protein N7511_005386 [Penicillium nucicola]|uniref:uncharacterized protein n=1 Tax=Penicillium nucicola TaxID=1850975 RepID=UPI0025454F60|nr:uncharacterized protein N7511_005386 [Penicillium nucicola]KAJ5762004.1 hypothetical protein N7511_005386 [Penicillium nucicola]
MSPFARPRVPALESQTGLSERELLNFIDGLNEAFMANPALQVTSRAGMVVGFVPLATTQIIGNCVEAAAGLGSAGVSVVRTKQYLKRVNQITFGPRGLCARVVKTEKMLSLVRVGGSFNSDQYSALVGRGSLERDYLDGQPSSGRDVSGQSVARVGSPIERRMELLGECVMRLSFDGVASPAEADNWMKRWGAYSAQQAEQKQLKKLKEKDEKKSRKSEKESRKTERKERKADNEIADIMDDIDDVQCQIQGLDLSRRKDEKTERELRKDLKKLERKLAELKDEREYEISRKSSRSDKKEMTRDEKEAKKIDKLYWIIILPVDRSTSGEHDLESEAEEQVVTEQAMRS